MKYMNTRIQILQGQYTSKDAIEFAAQMVHLIVKYHENQIKGSSSRTEIKFREAEIKRLLKELFEFRDAVERKKDAVKLESNLNIEV